VEMSKGYYPFPADEYDSVFAQLSAIVSGDPPVMDFDKFSPECRNFVQSCLIKDPKLRPTYTQLLDHPWFEKYGEIPTQEMIEWVTSALASRKERTKQRSKYI